MRDSVVARWKNSKTELAFCELLERNRFRVANSSCMLQKFSLPLLPPTESSSKSTLFLSFSLAKARRSTCIRVNKSRTSRATVTRSRKNFALEILMPHLYNYKTSGNWEKREVEPSERRRKRIRVKKYPRVFFHECDRCNKILTREKWSN